MFDDFTVTSVNTNSTADSCHFENRTNTKQQILSEYYYFISVESFDVVKLKCVS